MVPSSPNTDIEYSGLVDQINLDRGYVILADGQHIDLTKDFFEEMEIEVGLEPT